MADEYTVQGTGPDGETVYTNGAVDYHNGTFRWPDGHTTYNNEHQQVTTPESRMGNQEGYPSQAGPWTGGFTGTGRNPVGGDWFDQQLGGGQGGGQDPQAYFNSLFPGEQLSHEMLVAKQQELAQHGITLMPNASGRVGKIKLPDGQVIDVVQGGESGVNKKQWLGGGGGGGNMVGGMAGMGNFQTGSFTGGGQYPLASVMGQGLMAPWTTPFNAPGGGAAYQGTPFEAPPDFKSPGGFTAPNQAFQGQAFQSPGNFQSPGDFKAPDVTQDPGYQFRLKEGLKAIERTKSAQGRLNSGATLKALNNYAQDAASQEYGQAYGRALGENQMQYGRALGENELGYGRAMGENQLAYGRGQYANEAEYNRALQENQLGYGRAASEYDRMFGNKLAANQLQYGRGQYANETDYNRAMQQYNMARDIYGSNQQNQYNRLAGLAGTGQQAAGATGAYGTNYANQGGGYLSDIGQAGAAGQIYGQNPWTSYLNQMNQNLAYGGANRR